MAIIEKDFGDFRPSDFSFVIEHLPDNCPIVGGQAVSWWAQVYEIFQDNGLPVTSSDIDFWGDRNDLKLLASRLGLKPIFPHEYEMTVWAGAIQIRIDDKRSLAEFLHTVPGLDVVDPDRASVEQVYRAAAVTRTIQVLTPTSLIPVKLHCLRHFSQDGRSDELHLRITLKTARRFLANTLDQTELRQLFWNVERIITAHRFKPYRRLEKSLGFNLLDAVPIDEMRRASENSEFPADDRERLARFISHRWTQVLAEIPED